jgi:hypothetical protein
VVLRNSHTLPHFDHIYVTGICAQWFVRKTIIGGLLRLNLRFLNIPYFSPYIARAMIGTLGEIMKYEL